MHSACSAFFIFLIGNWHTSLRRCKQQVRVLIMPAKESNDRRIRRNAKQNELNRKQTRIKEEAKATVMSWCLCYANKARGREGARSRANGEPNAYGEQPKRVITPGICEANADRKNATTRCRNRKRTCEVLLSSVCNKSRRAVSVGQGKPVLHHRYTTPAS